MESADEEIPRDFRPIFVFIASIEILVGVAGNSILLYVLFRSRLMGKRGYYNLFIANLALADLIVLIYWLPFFVFYMILGYYPVANMEHCRANGFIIRACTVVSLLTLASISFNRYLHVCHIHLYRRVFTKTTVIVWCLLLWFVGAGVSSPVLFASGSQEDSIISYLCVLKATEYVHQKILSVLIPLGSTVAIGYFNVAIFCMWKRTTRNFNRRLLVSVFSSKILRRRFLSLCSCSQRCTGKAQAKQSKKTKETEDCGQQAKRSKTSKETGNCGLHDNDIEVKVVYCRGRTLAPETFVDRTERENTGQTTVRPSSSISGLRKDKQATSLASPGAANSEETQQSSDNTHLCECSELDETHSVKPTPAGRLSVEDADHETDQESEEYITLKLDTRDEAQYTANDGTLSDIVTEPSSPETATEHSLSKTQQRRSGRDTDTFWQQIVCRRRQQQRRERVFVRSLMVISLLTVICYLPYGAFKSLEEFFPPSAKSVAYVFVILLLFVNNSVNWIVYGVMNRSFRREYVRVIDRFMCTGPRNTCKK